MKIIHYTGNCSLCNKLVQVGDIVVFNRDPFGSVYVHEECPKRREQRDPVQVQERSA